MQLNKISQTNFTKKIKNREYEDLEIISLVEKYLIKKRGYVVSKPKKGESVILLLSGGLDSTVAWNFLLRDFKVYPIFCYTKKSSEYFSVKHYGKIFRKEFPLNYREPFFVKINKLNKKFSSLSRVRELHPARILDVIASQKYTDTEIPFLVGLNSLFVYYAASYIEYLFFKKNIKVNSIICAITADDGIGIKNQTQTFLRITLLSLIKFINVKDLQFYSLFFDKTLGYYLNKKHIIKLAKHFSLNLNKTYSCYSKHSLFHCGKCLGCISRKYYFNKAEVEDKTFYIDKYIKSFHNKIEKILFKIKRIL